MVSSAWVILALCPAAAAVNMADSKEASAEVATKCMKGDYSGASALLESRGAPIGWQHGKYMLMSCFTDETGQCLLDGVRCNWLQQCLEEEGPCAAPPVTALLEIAGGEVAYAELTSDANASVTVQNQTRYKMKKILEVTKAMSESAPKDEELAEEQHVAAEKLASSLLQQGSQGGQSVFGGRRRKDRIMAKIKEENALLTTTPDPLVVAVKEFKKPGAQMKKMIDNFRKNWMDTKQKRRFLFQLATLPLYYLATCGMEDLGVMMKDGKPLYAKFAPNGKGKKPEYIDAVHEYKWHPDLLEKGGEWVCAR